MTRLLGSTMLLVGLAAIASADPAAAPATEPRDGVGKARRAALGAGESPTTRLGSQTKVNKTGAEPLHNPAATRRWLAPQDEDTGNPIPPRRPGKRTPIA